MSRAMVLLCALAIVVAALASCGSTPNRAPVESVPVGAEARARHATQPNLNGRAGSQSHYTVVKGDTLYSIAWRHGLDYRQVAQWNGIRRPYLIYPGDVLRLRPPVASAKQTKPAAERKPAPTLQRSSQGSQPVVAAADRTSKPTASPQTRVAIAPPGTRLTWRWPTEGAVVANSSALGRNGISIGGKFGQSIYAAEDGKVVYSGSGLTGYGKLIIIKHNDTFLSAYAHNSRLMVSEGTVVKAGQKIAEMGRVSREEPRLHFEIRRNGKPVPPQQYLPKRQL